MENDAFKMLQKAEDSEYVSVKEKVDVEKITQMQKARTAETLFTESRASDIRNNDISKSMKDIKVHSKMFKYNS